MIVNDLDTCLGLGIEARGYSVPRSPATISKMVLRFGTRREIEEVQAI
jgi:hypothetical protein